MAKLHILNFVQTVKTILNIIVLTYCLNFILF